MGRIPDFERKLQEMQLLNRDGRDGRGDREGVAAVAATSIYGDFAQAGEMGRGGKSKNAASSVFLIWKRVDFILSDSLVFRGIFSFFSGRLFLRPGRRWGRFQGSGRFR